MRVIAGTAKGRKLVAPHGVDTRPTPARVREALFSILAAQVPGARVLDLFAGTGALGIEALSRGASHATFVERDRRAREALERNIAPFGTAAELLFMSATQALRQLARLARPFAIIFMDPPYAQGLLPGTLAAVAAAGLLASDGTVVCEHPGRSAPPAPPAAWACSRTRVFGDVAVSLFGPQASYQASRQASRQEGSPA